MENILKNSIYYGFWIICFSFVFSVINYVKRLMRPAFWRQFPTYTMSITIVSNTSEKPSDTHCQHHRLICVCSAHDCKRRHHLLCAAALTASLSSLQSFSTIVRSTSVWYSKAKEFGLRVLHTAENIWMKRAREQWPVGTACSDSVIMRRHV